MSFKPTKEDCEAAVKSYFRSSNFTLKDFIVKPLSDRNVGFLGRHLTVTASVFRDNKVQEVHFFAKLTPDSDVHRSLVNSCDFFGKEILIYNTIVPELKATLQPNVKFPVPRCLFSRTIRNWGKFPDPNSAKVVLMMFEDVRYLGYYTLENCPPLDLLHCRAILKTMAKFHGASILLEEAQKKSQPGLHPSKGVFSCIKESFLVSEKGHFGYEWSQASAETTATAATKMWPQRFQGKREELCSALKVAWKKVFAMAQTSDKYKNVLCHGDVWTNNALFAHKKSSDGQEIPVDVLLVDFQLVRYAPPILDILLFLHVCTRRSFREKHIMELLEYYHSSLEEFVTPDLLERVLPFASFLESFEEFRNFGRVMSTAYIPNIMGEYDPTLSTEDKPIENFDITEAFLSDKGNMIARNCKRSETYRERLEENFGECIEGIGMWKN